MVSLSDKAPLMLEQPASVHRPDFTTPTVPNFLLLSYTFNLATMEFHVPRQTASVK